MTIITVFVGLPVLGLLAGFQLSDVKKRGALEHALQNSESLSEFKRWAYKREYFPDDCGFDEPKKVWKLPCQVPPTEWMNNNGEDVLCFSIPTNGPRDLASEFLAAFILPDGDTIGSFAVAHVDRWEGMGTWQGLLLPEDYGGRGWCEFDASSRATMARSAFA